MRLAARARSGELRWSRARAAAARGASFCNGRALGDDRIRLIRSPPYGRGRSATDADRKPDPHPVQVYGGSVPTKRCRSEEHTSELQSLMRISYAVFCLKKK